MKFRYKIEWRYTDGNELHTTYTECNHQTVRAALNRFHSFFNRIHDDDGDFGYVVVSVICLGTVIKRIA